MWETLEGMVREKAQEFIQQIMEEEVTELLGREKSEGRSTVDSAFIGFLTDHSPAFTA